MAKKNSIEKQLAIGKVSKNARTSGSVTQKFFHGDGGQILVVMRFKNGHLVPEAECQLCHKIARKIRDLMLE